MIPAPTSMCSPNYISKPEVGSGATVYFYSDRKAATIIGVRDKFVVVQLDQAIRTDKNGMSDMQSYEYMPNPNGKIMKFSLRKNGRWVEVGGDMKSGTSLGIGFRREYFDFSF